MLHQKTVLIIGAGTSEEARMPLGGELCNTIGKMYDWREHQSPRLSQALEKAGLPPNSASIKEIAKFLSTEMPGERSIDDFLYRHSDNDNIVKLGKIGIVKSILEAESQSLLRGHLANDEWLPLDLKTTWYSGFFQILQTGVPRTEVEGLFENLEIINFNYDRCLERFLAQKISSSYRLDLKKSYEIVDGLNMHRPYGKVGGLPWQKDGIHVPFGCKEACLLDLSRQIRTFTEGFVEDTVKSRCHHALHNASRIVFLGFGFHPQNIEFLTFSKPTINYNTRVWVTSYKQPGPARRVINDMVASVVRAGYNLPDDHYADMRCRQWCEDYFTIMTSKY